MNAIDTYISQQQPEIQARLMVLRQLFSELLPNTEESMRYKMPAFKVGNNHLYFAVYKKYIGFYPVYGLAELEEDMRPFRAKDTKDSLHFLHSEPLPLDLIRKIILLKAVAQ